MSRELLWRGQDSEDRSALAGGRFGQALALHGLGPPTREAVRTVQVNLGRRCNMSCRHCHVDAAPGRVEMMASQTARRVIELVGGCPTVETLDLTGGAPELNPHFRFLVTEARRLGLEVIDRSNLTILLEAGMEDLGQFLADQGVHVVASLPCYLSENVDHQRGAGAYQRSIEALRSLNALGYGHADSALKLDLVYNPGGAFLPPAQDRLESDYKQQLHGRWGVEFHRLYTITNMPISRFAEHLERNGEREAYVSLLESSFNHETAPGLMCRTMISVGWDGRLSDCDFNQVLGLPLSELEAQTVESLESLSALGGRPIHIADHCFGCTAGAGSSCRGALG